MLTWPGWSKNSAWALRLRGRDAPARAKCLSGLLLGESERQRLTDPGKFLQGRLADRIRPKKFQCDAENPAGRSKGSSCEAAPEGRTRGVLSVRSARRGASPPFRNLPPGRSASRRTATGWAPCVRGEQSEVAPAKPALGSGTLTRRGTSTGSEIARHGVECSASSAGFARAPNGGRFRRGPSRPPPIERCRWALFSDLRPARAPPVPSGAGRPRSRAEIPRRGWERSVPHSPTRHR